MVSSPALVIMAAGIGSRYGGLKQVEPIGPSGEMVIDYSIYDALRAGFGRVVFLIRRDLEGVFRERVGAHIDGRVETEYVFQDLSAGLPPGFTLPERRVKPWGTGHAVLCCREAVCTPFAVINADDFYGAGAFQALGAYLGEAHDQGQVLDACMAGYLLRNTLSEFGSVARGICRVDAAGDLAGIREHTRIEKMGDGARSSLDGGASWEPLDPQMVVSMNLFGFTPGIFAELANRFPIFLAQNAANLLKAEYFLPEVVNALLKEKRLRVRVLPVGEQWYGVTYPQDRPAVQAAIRGLVDRGVYPSKLWS